MATTYAPIRGGAVLVGLALAVGWFVAVVSLVGVGLLVGALTGLVAAMSTWIFGRQLPIELRIDPAARRVAWRSLLGRGELDADDLARLRPARFERSMLVLESRGQRSLVLVAGPGLGAALDALRASAPELEVDLGPWVDRLAELDRRRDVRR